MGKEAPHKLQQGFLTNALQVAQDKTCNSPSANENLHIYSMLCKINRGMLQSSRGTENEGQ